ncbi:hypothetical protein D1AOALGA4SA_12554 [Olavius algarvensis Delta 1 endosymbiont]|nr:hypothetical protein D1AOALGA4SA_12554 [Olavius algarvensis Delta 1 endosymbiont]
MAALLRFEWTACSGTGGRLPPVYPVDITGICTRGKHFTGQADYPDEIKGKKDFMGQAQIAVNMWW